MNKNSDVGSNMSLDSLEENFKRAASIKDETSEENLDTILVPFYEQDVLIKVPKSQKKNQGREEKNKTSKNINKSYLINKRTNQSSRNSYLKMFRKKNDPKFDENVSEEQEIRSLSPEYGDTERESICEDVNYPNTDFVNTESYNEMYYEKLMEKELNKYLDNSFENEVQLNQDIENKSLSEQDKLTSVSETSLPKRVSHSPMRRAPIDLLNNVKLGGLGPDMEKIKPRLERARSLQRYSEKVRMENRLKIYKKSIEIEKEKLFEKQSSPKQHTKNEATKPDSEGKQSSYLINRTSKDKKSLQLLRKTYCLKSACTPQSNKNEKEKHKGDKNVGMSDVVRNKSASREKKPKLQIADQKERVHYEGIETRKKSAGLNKTINMEEKVINTVPPVKISFMVNFEGVRPSSALKTLEAKHKMYQEKVKKYTVQKENI
ncbi:uncharacterized protein [Battus philenor]|uniref:uncharacterized protein n=1 Tax=Battus philenor TaxID=42288 RepID=UPI0035D03402